MAFPDYSIANDTANGTVNPSALHAEVIAAGPYTEPFHGIETEPDADLLTVSFADLIPSGEQAIVNGVVAAHQGEGTLLDVAKKSKCAKIDARTAQLIDVGFEFPPSSGAYLSCSLEAQSTLNLLYCNRTGATYPVEWSTRDNLNKVTLSDANDVASLLARMQWYVQTQRSSGDVIKDAVRACTTVAKVEAIVDPR
jgi:hypothetical protein